MAPEAMLCRAARTLPPEAGWVLEPKWDGYRMLFSVERDRVSCHTRNGRSHAGRFPYLEAELRAAFGTGAVVDGEIVALAAGGDGSAGQDFDRLGPIFAASRPHEPEECGLYFVAFDVPAHRGEDLRRRPWHERRAVLERALPERRGNVAPIATTRCSPEAHAEHLAAGFEGSVAKRRGGRYLPGRRSWLKLKARHEVEVKLLVVGRQGRPDDELRVLCGEENDGEIRAVGWASVWTPELRRAAERGELAGAWVRVVYTNRTARGRLREARVTALASPERGASA